MESKGGTFRTVIGVRIESCHKGRYMEDGFA